MGINSVHLGGNLTRDPEMRTTKSGTNVLTFGLAFSERVLNNRTGEWEERPNFADCAVFGKRAEALSRILKKGMHVTVEGRLRYESWEASDGSKRSKLSVVVDEVELPPRSERTETPKPARQADAYSTDDIPF